MTYPFAQTSSLSNSICPLESRFFPEPFSKVTCFFFGEFAEFRMLLPNGSSGTVSPTPDACTARRGHPPASSAPCGRGPRESAHRGCGSWPCTNTWPCVCFFSPPPPRFFFWFLFFRVPSLTSWVDLRKQVHTCLPPKLLSQQASSPGTQAASNVLHKGNIGTPKAQAQLVGSKSKKKQPPEPHSHRKKDPGLNWVVALVS